MPTKRVSKLAGLRQAQEQMRSAAVGIQDTLTQPDPQELDAVAGRPAQKNFSQKSFTLWDTAISMAMDELRKLRDGELLKDSEGNILTDSKGHPISASLFTAADIFKCGNMAKDASALLLQVIKNRADVEDQVERRELQKIMIESVTGKPLKTLPAASAKGRK